MPRHRGRRIEVGPMRRSRHKGTCQDSRCFSVEDAPHPEFGPAASRCEFKRGDFVKAAWRL
jgi:hypothetical protein